MVDISLDLVKTSDTYKQLLIENGDLVLTKDANPSGTNNIQQDIVQAIGFTLGEWFMNNTEGIDYRGQVFIKNPDQSKIDAILQNTICGVPGVQTLTQYSAKPDLVNRICKVSFVAETTSGRVDYSGTIAIAGGI